MTNTVKRNTWLVVAMAIGLLWAMILPAIQANALSNTSLLLSNPQPSPVVITRSHHLASLQGQLSAVLIFDLTPWPMVRDRQLGRQHRHRSRALQLSLSDLGPTTIRPMAASASRTQLVKPPLLAAI